MAIVPLSAATAAAPLAHPLAAPLISLPDQVQQLTVDTIVWFRQDSSAALLGVAVAVALYAGFFGLRWGIVRVLGRSRDVATWRGFLSRIVSRTRSFFIAALAAYAVTHIVAPPGPLQRAIDFAFTVAFAVQGAYWVREIVLSLVERRASNAEDHAALASAMGIIRVLVNVVVWMLATILVLDNLGVNVTALVAGLGVGGIAIGLAAQGIFSDLFAALAILFDRPFRAGDTIRFGEVTGKVEAIGLKTVRIRANTGEQVIVSNTKLLDQQIRNLRRIEARTAVMTLQISLGAPAAALRQVPGMVEALVAGIGNAVLNHARIIAASPIAYELEIDLTVADSSLIEMLNARQAVVIGVTEGLERLGLELADTTPRAGSSPPPEPPPATTETPQ